MGSVIKFIIFLVFISLSVHNAKEQARDFGMLFILIFSIGIGYYLFYYLPQNENKKSTQLESTDLQTCKKIEEDSRERKEISLYTNDYDYLLHDILPNSSSIILDLISKKTLLDKFQAKIILDRWLYFHLIDYIPYEDKWVPTIPHQTLTVEQFIKSTNISKISVKITPKTNELYFDYGINKKGIVMNNEIPKHPMLSQIICSNSLSYWILHEEGQLSSPPILVNF